MSYDEVMPKARCEDYMNTELVEQTEKVFDNGEIEILTGRANPQLAHDVAGLLGKCEDDVVSRFPDSEVRVKISSELRKKSVFIFQPTSPPSVDENLMELLLTLDAAKRASAAEVTAVIPYFGYSRQDWKEQSGVPISSALAAGLIQFAGADRLLTIDIHSNQSQGFIRAPWDNLWGSPVLISHMRELLDPPNLVIVSPDASGVKRAYKDAVYIGTPYIAVVYKDRDIHTGKTTAIHMSGAEYIDGKDVLIVDDMLAGGGSAINAAVEAKKHGARRIWFAATHGLFLGSALDDLWKSPIDKIYVTDTVRHHPFVQENKKIEIVPIAPLLAEAIRRIHTGQTMSDLFME